MEGANMRRGFTLLELLLVIALLLAIAAMAIPTFSSALARRQLAESAEHLRSLMYLARAEAAGGKRLQILFTDPVETNYLAQWAGTTGQSGEATGAVGQAYCGVQVFLERDPLGSPGAFDRLQTDWANWKPAGPTVQICQVAVSEPMTVAAEKGGAESARDAPPMILFGHDGRSQVGDVTITLMNDRLDGYVVKLRGATGLATVGPRVVEEDAGVSQ